MAAQDFEASVPDELSLFVKSSCQAIITLHEIPGRACIMDQEEQEALDKLLRLGAGGIPEIDAEMKNLDAERYRNFRQQIDLCVEAKNDKTKAEASLKEGEKASDSNVDHWCYVQVWES